ncbi:MAG: glycine--tRNA ligase subunit alpha [Candidatus Azosocius agrarius]|nr:MAG: glycine--tRNA ligase subunit alpha [Gammaproteobacteria bacterium]
MKPFLTVQNIISELHKFWQNQGCIILQPIDLEVGAGSFHPDTFFRAIGPEPWKAAFVQPSRRPIDSRYGSHPNRNQHYYQYQVILKPNPKDIQDLYIKSLKKLHIFSNENDIRFIEDNWESPSIGAWGIGWEVWLNGMEVTQFTYFQQMGGLECNPVMGEITYGLERIAMYVQKQQSINKLYWSNNLKYEDIFIQREQEMSKYNLEIANQKLLVNKFNYLEKECTNAIKNKLPYPSYEIIIKLSHIFNLLDSRSALSTIERQHFIYRIRSLSSIVANLYYNIRNKINFPLLTNFKEK